jgi:hypothetical protein
MNAFGTALMTCGMSLHDRPRQAVRRGVPDSDQDWLYQLIAG